MKAARSRPALFLAMAITALMAAALAAYAATSRTDTGPQAVAIQPTGMSVPF